MKKVRLLAPLALLVVSALVVGACSAQGDEDAASGSAAAGVVAADMGVAEAAPPAEAPASEEAVRGAVGGVADDLAVPTIEVSAQLPGIPQRVIQNATLAITVPKGEFDRVIDQARTVAAGLGGFVTTSSASQGGEDRLVRGTIVVRVPQESYAQAMAAFTKLGKITSRTESGQDVSLQYVDLEARGRHLEALEQQLLRFLDQTTTVSDALIVQGQLNEVQLQLEQIRGELRYLDSQTAYATITFEVAERGVPAVAPAADGGGWGFSEAWAAASRGFEKVLGGALVALVTAGPILGVLAAAFYGWRLHSRRRRTATATAVQPATPTAAS